MDSSIILRLAAAERGEGALAVQREWVNLRKEHGDTTIPRVGVTCCGPEPISLRSDGVPVTCSVCGREASFAEVVAAHGFPPPRLFTGKSVSDKVD